MAALPKSRQRRLARIAVEVLFIVVAGSGAYAFHVRSEARARIAAQKSADAAERQRKLDELTRALDTQSGTLAAALTEVIDATNETDRAAAQVKVAAAEAERKRTAIALAELQGVTLPSAVPTPPRTHCTCDAGDPLCSML